MGIVRNICCVCAQDIKGAMECLLNEIETRTNISIPVVDNDVSMANFDVVIPAISQGAIADDDIPSLLKKASHLNKTFLPVLMGNCMWKNWNLKRKFKGFEFRSPYYCLNKDNDRLRFFSQLVSLSGLEIVGDPYGRVFSVVADQDCQVIRSNEVIAELFGGQPKDITLYLGRHKLNVKCKCFDISKVLILKVDDISSDDKESIKISFFLKLIIESTANCLLYDGDAFLAKIICNQESVIQLPPGHHKLKFEHPTCKYLNRYCSINMNKSKRVVYTFPSSPQECSI